MTSRRMSKSINVLSSIPLSELPDEEDDDSLSPLAASACVLPSCCRCLQDIEVDISSKVSAYRSTASVIVCSDDPAYHRCSSRRVVAQDMEALLSSAQSPAANEQWQSMYSVRILFVNMV